MPLVTVYTSAESPAEGQGKALLSALSEAVARILGKPEKYVMTCLVPRTAMTFGGSFEPACSVEIKSIGGLTPDRSARLSEAVCELLPKALGISRDRVYVVCEDVPAHLWGWNGATFG
jgi:phenylpyruvate tautomerase PptA (4-oxalocrotonate tautomerase family)